MTSTRIDRPDRDVRKQGSPSTQHYSQTICPDARQPTLTLTLSSGQAQPPTGSLSAS